jgi:hypothetical protein
MIFFKTNLRKLLAVSSRPERGSERAFNRPTVIEPIAQNVVGKPGRFAPLDKRLRFALECYHSVLSRVAHLLLLTCPSNIARTVSLVVVDSIQRVRERWCWTDILQKLFKFNPTRFHESDAAPAIILVIRRVFIAATGEHVKPGFVVLRHFAAHSLPVFNLAASLKRFQIFRFQAAATFCQSTPQAVSDNGYCSTAAASDPPSCGAIVVNAVKANHYEAVKYLSRQIVSSQLSFSHNERFYTSIVRKSIA